MPNQEWTEPPEDQPPAGPLPDGSMPVYANHPLPGMPGGDPPMPDLGWGPDVGAGHDIRHSEPPHRRRRAGLVLGLLIICGLAAALVIAALVTIA